MQKASIIQKETEQIGTVEDLTGVFESIASTQVAKVKDKVQLSKEFFDLLWQKYITLRIDPNDRITKRLQANLNPKKVFVVISAEAGLSGDIDQRLIETMLKDFDKNTTDVVVLGTHGANQLKSLGIPIVHFFQVPESESYIDVSPIISIINSYSKITVYYEEYISLGVQGIKKIDLFSTIEAMSENSDPNEITMTAQDTIFEPSIDEIAQIMEKAMITLALSQVILESNLAQNASRFNAMGLAKKRAFELINAYKLDYHRAKRSERDRSLREVMVSLKRKHRAKSQL